MKIKHIIWCFARVILTLAIVTGTLQVGSFRTQAAAQFTITGPAGSVQFGYRVTVLPNGNFVVIDPTYNGGIGVDAGAAYLYDGASGMMISMLTGMTAGDKVGHGGVVVLANGNYLVASPLWDNGGISNAGAVTWGSSVSGISGAVTAANSLVGSSVNESVGTYCAVTLTNGNYVVCSPYWDKGAVADAGAATWGNGNGGTVGVISSANSLVGSKANDMVGSGITYLSNGNYVVRSPLWDNGAIVDAGAATWGNGNGGTVGAISAANSLVGGTSSDRITDGGVARLDNGNYVVISPGWDNGVNLDAGAVTWGNGNGGTVGVVSAANSLVGSKTNDWVGYGGVKALKNSNYVVASTIWDNGTTIDAGAVTWGNGASGVFGVVSAANSLVGSSASDKVGENILPLSNGNYVVRSAKWNNGSVTDAGAITWGNGNGGTIGAISAANSLVGSTASDVVGFGIWIALNNGNYVFSSMNWDNGAVINAGAVTWGNGNGGTVGLVSTANSLVGSTANDKVGSSGLTRLENNNYVICSLLWDNGALMDAGAVSWGNGNGGTVGVVSAANSLVGGAANDKICDREIMALSNGNYVVNSSQWDNGAVANAGAVTWGNGNGGTVGVVSAANSLVGSTANDQVGSNPTIILAQGNYLVRSPLWDSSAVLTDVGALTWGSGNGGTVGAVSAANSLVGSTAGDQVGNDTSAGLSNGSYVVLNSVWDNVTLVNAGALTWWYGHSRLSGPVNKGNSLLGVKPGKGYGMNFNYDEVNHQLVVGRPYDNLVTLLKLSQISLPHLVK
ncbi:MAG: hypothetical protein JXB15_16580 [Anaerolineales bacterium]|nr:hypothetical protein [Anaerolineales bacterium]